MPKTGDTRTHCMTDCSQVDIRSVWVWGVGNNELLLIDCICTPAVTRGYAWRHTAGGPLSHRAAAEPLPPPLSRLCDPLNMHTNSPLVDAVVPGGMEFVLVPGPATGVGADRAAEPVRERPVPRPGQPSGRQ